MSRWSQFIGQSIVDITWAARWSYEDLLVQPIQTTHPKDNSSHIFQIGLINMARRKTGKSAFIYQLFCLPFHKAFTLSKAMNPSEINEFGLQSYSSGLVLPGMPNFYSIGDAACCHEETCWIFTTYQTFLPRSASYAKKLNGLLWPNSSVGLFDVMEYLEQPLAASNMAQWYWLELK